MYIDCKCIHALPGKIVIYEGLSEQTNVSTKDWGETYDASFPKYLLDNTISKKVKKFSLCFFQQTLTQISRDKEE